MWPSQVTLNTHPRLHNSINAKSIDVIPVSILTPETFQASDVHPTAVRSTQPALRLFRCSLPWRIGDIDMVLQFKTKRSAARMIRDDVKQTPGYVQALEHCRPRQGPTQMRSMGVTHGRLDLSQRPCKCWGTCGILLRCIGGWIHI